MPSPDRSELALQNLMAGHAAGRLAHAYIVVGSPRGEGLSFAKSAAQLVLCGGLTRPCGGCDACRQVDERTHPDVFWLEPEKKSRIIGIDAVRELNARLSQKSYLGGWKVAILVHADRLNMDGANAFLKTLEEPSPHTLILLVTDAPQAMLATTVSRCQRIQLTGGERPADATWTPDLLAVLERPAGRGTLDRLARAREVQSLLDAERRRIEKEVDAELRKSDEPIAKDVRDARIDSQVKQVRADLLQTMLLWQRDALLLASGGDRALMHFPDRFAAISDAARRDGVDAQIASIQGLETLIRRLDRNVKPEILAFEACFLASEN